MYSTIRIVLYNLIARIIIKVLTARKIINHKNDDGYILSVTEVDGLFFDDNTKFVLHNPITLNVYAFLT